MTIDDAARLLGVSPTTVRRWVKDGRIKSERVVRPQGYVVLVELPSTTPAAGHPPQVSTELPTVAPTDLARADAMATYLAAYAEKITSPLIATIADQAELIGDLKARLAALQSPQSEPMPTEPTPAAEAMLEPARRVWWRRFW